MRSWFLGFFALALIGSACGEDRPALNKPPPTAGTSSGGQGAFGQGGFNQLSGGTSSSSGGGGGRPPEETPRETVFTFVHGIVDADRVMLCIVKGQGNDAVALGSPQPEAGLGYGEALVLHGLDGVDYVHDTIQPLVIAGELGRVSGLDCTAALALAAAEQAAGEGVAAPGGESTGGAGGMNAEAGSSAGGAASGAGSGGAAGAENVAGAASSSGGQAGSATGGSGGASNDGEESGDGGENVGPLPEPPKLRVGALPILPGGTLAGGRSYLFVADGCIGGPAFATRWNEQVCGDGYTALTPSVSGLLVPMSREKEFGLVGLQVVGGSLATPTVDVVSAPLLPAQSSGMVTVAGGVSPGRIVPRPPQVVLSAADFGANKDAWRLQVLLGSQAVYSEQWSEVRERANIEELADSENYVLVLLGPSMSFTREGFWNPRRISLLLADP